MNDLPSLTETFEKQCPYYLSIGMPYDLYWYGDCYATVYYREAYTLKYEQENERLWLQGMYNYKAFSSAFEAFSYGMSGGKGAKPKGYFAHPIAITENEKRAEKQRKIKHTMEFVAKGQMNERSNN